MIRLPPIELGPFKGIWHQSDKSASMCPKDMLHRCENYFIHEYGVTKRDAIEISDTLGHQALSIYLISGSGVTSPYWVACTATATYVRKDVTATWSTLESGLIARTYASVSAYQGNLFIADDKQQLRFWNFSEGTMTTVTCTNPPVEICADIFSCAGIFYAFSGTATTDLIYVADPLNGPIDVTSSSTAVGPVFESPYALRVPDNRGGFKVLKMFEFGTYYGDHIVILTDKCPIVLSGTGLNNFRMIPKYTFPGMRADARNACCLGTRGVYYLDNDYDVRMFEGYNAYNITKGSFNHYIRDDMYLTNIGQTCMWCDGEYVYLSYPSIAAGNKMRVMVFEEQTMQWVSDWRGWDIISAATSFTKAPTVSSVARAKYVLAGQTYLGTYPTALSSASENFTSLVETAEVCPAPGMLTVFDEIETVSEVNASGSFTGTCIIDGITGSNVPVRLINPQASGTRFGDEDNTTTTRQTTVTDVWRVSHNTSVLNTGRRLRMRYEHTGTTPNVIQKTVITPYVSSEEAQKEVAK